MQCRQLHTQHQNARIRIRPHDVAGGADRSDGSVTAHEADQQPLNRRGKSKLAGNNLVNAGCDKPSATGDDEMGETADVGAAGEVLNRRDR